ncbi:recombinase RecQ [Neisseria chenwenguii]|uniref:DNA 3'-5' helicase n=1 Tax=Neisseria chenwenguii TaxID=1853278 RepID=A0A220S3H7_9NEIS|nr:RecQ family ATP-dependent DNA helicase [Neisseria chenwenguii]ASK28059.1 recombinase RecQ [Neisseria chenwenguii]
MKPAVLIVDLEVNPQTGTVFKLGAYRPDLDQGFESGLLRSHRDFQTALNAIGHLTDGAEYLMGHNILAHDLRYLTEAAPELPWLALTVIDTLRLSPLAFPQNPYHRLIKNHKIVSSAANSPEADCRAAWRLFQDQCAAFGRLRMEKPDVFAVYCGLYGALPYALSDGLMVLPRLPSEKTDPKTLIPKIWDMVHDDAEQGRLKVCRTRFKKLMQEDVYQTALHPALAYALSWLTVSGGNSVLAPWVRHQFPDTARLIDEMRDRDCGDAQCRYCADTLNPRAQLARYFPGMDGFRAVKGFEGGQEAVVKAGMNGGHVLAVLPTGGGKSLCYQLPALNRYHRNGGLTIVVSPLQSLMKDQADGLKKRGVSCAAALNGMLSVTERADVLDKISLGDIGILFVAPEQFRNAGFIKAISQRQINGWVFDEAHCLSKWGHDFRPDYLYAAKFIKNHYAKHPDLAPAPISCFTATAKPDVLQEITGHFREELGIEFKQFIGDNRRENLSYEVLEVSDGLKNERIHALLSRELAYQTGGAVVFVARRKSAEAYADFLKQKGWACAHFHAGLEPNEKAEVQEHFINGNLRVIVATNAFGMGVDKPDVRLVIHAEITGSLENYLQEAGRAGRDQKDARCVLLFDREDVDTQFGISRRSQLELRDLKTVWKKLGFLNAKIRAADGETDPALVITGSEILRDSEDFMSFDRDDRQSDTKVKTALAWLERSGLLERTENQTKIFPARSGRLNLEQALAKIEKAGLGERKKALFQNIVETVYAAKDDEILSTDELADSTGCSFAELRGFLKDLEELGILDNDTRLTVNLRTDHLRPSEKQLAQNAVCEEALWKLLKEEIPDADRGIWQNLSLTAVCRRLAGTAPDKVPADWKTLVYALADDKAADREQSGGNLEIRDAGNDVLRLRFKYGSGTWEQILNDAAQRRNVCAVILAHLVEKAGGVRNKDVQVETGFKNLTALIAADLALAAQIPEKRREILIRQSLLFMHKLKIIRLNHGMTILRHAMTVRLNPAALAEKRQYVQADFQPLKVFYGGKKFQIHVMQEYALRALKSLETGLTLVHDYFNSSEKDFKNKWFKGRFPELEEEVSGGTLKKITDGLNAQQKAVVTDKSGRNRLVLAGPGSGKTRVIVHRAAYLLRVQHADPASVIILAFNRLAAQEIKRRLFALVGRQAAAVTVLTYDGMAMRILGVRFEDIRKDDGSDGENRFKQWCRQAARLLSDGLGADGEDSARDRILAGFRYILVDEYQDITAEHYALVSALAGRRADEDDKLTILAVGDDDQNIYSFNGTSNEYIHRFRADYGVETPDYLTLNYRSTQHIVSAANRLIGGMESRLKTLHPIAVNPERQAEANGGRWAEIDRERQGRVRIIRLNPSACRANVQAQAVIAEIARLRQIEDIPFRDIAVLSRENAALKPLQAWCERDGIPYFLAKDRENGIRLRQTREFVRLADEICRHNKERTTAEFTALLNRQDVCATWRDFLKLMSADFAREYPMPSENQAEARRHPAAFLKNWLYDYVGNRSENRSDGLFLGTAHSAKGLEFKHVFILDDQWAKYWHGDTDAERRLYYVAMTRAVETLTLIGQTPHHRFIETMPSESETVTQQFAPLAALDTEYRVLTPEELDLGFAVRCPADRPPTRQTVMPRLLALSRLKTDDPLQWRRLEDGRYEFLSDGIPVARTSRKARLPELSDGCRASAAAFFVRYRAQEDETFAARYPAEVEKWTVVMPRLVIHADKDANGK